MKANKLLTALVVMGCVRAFAAPAPVPTTTPTQEQPAPGSAKESAQIDGVINGAKAIHAKATASVNHRLNNAAACHALVVAGTLKPGGLKEWMCVMKGPPK